MGIGITLKHSILNPINKSQKKKEKVEIVQKHEKLSILNALYGWWWKGLKQKNLQKV